MVGAAWSSNLELCFFFLKRSLRVCTFVPERILCFVQRVLEGIAVRVRRDSVRVRQLFGGSLVVHSKHKDACQQLVQTDDLVARTFFSVLSCRTCLSTFFLHACMRVAQDVHMCCPCARSKVIPSHSMFHKTLLGVPDTFSSFCSSPPQTTPTSRPLTGIRSTPCATSAEPLPPTVGLAAVAPHRSVCGGGRCGTVPTHFSEIIQFGVALASSESGVTAMQQNP